MQKVKLIKSSLQDNIIIGRDNLFSFSKFSNDSKIFGISFFSFYALNKDNFFPFIYDSSRKLILTNYLKKVDNYQNFITNNTVIITHEILLKILNKFSWKLLNEFNLNKDLKLVINDIPNFYCLFFNTGKNLFYKKCDLLNLEINFKKDFYEEYKDKLECIDYNIVYESIFE